MGKTTKQTAPVQLRLGSELTIWKAGELKATLVEALAGAGEVELDLSAVEAADLTCLQLLCSAHRTAVARGTRLWIGEASAVILELIESAGFTRHVGCSEGCLWVPPGDVQRETPAH